MEKPGELGVPEREIPKPAAMRLDTSKSNKKIWLVKVPAFIAERWRTACDNSANKGIEENLELGRVRITKNTSESSKNFELLLSGPSAEGIPKEFVLRQQSDDVPLHVFSQHEANMAVEGVVTQKFDTEMGTRSLDASYRNIHRERNLQASTKTRKMQVIDLPSAQAEGASSGVGMSNPVLLERIAAKRKAAAQAAAAKAKPPEQKRSRMEKDDLERLLFRLFEQKSGWRFVELQESTNQPAAFLKQVLNGIASLNRQGRVRDQYVLKEEYQTSRPAQAEGDA